MDSLIGRLRRIKSLRHRKKHQRLGSDVFEAEEPELESLYTLEEKQVTLSSYAGTVSKHHLAFAAAFTPSPPTATTTVPEDQYTPRDASPFSQLERLPFEVQRPILSAVPDLSTLRALVHASPTLHSVYTQDWPRILKEVTDRTIADGALDAHAAHLTGTESFRRRDITGPVMSGFLKEYKESLITGSSTPTLASSTVRPVDYTHLARFHLSVVEPLTELYAAWALEGLAALEPSQATHPLSETERQRIQRALYRLQTFCNLCSRRSPYPMWTADHRLEILSVFPPWEVEEIMCIYEFAKEKVNEMFHQISQLPGPFEPGGRSLVNDRGEPDPTILNYILTLGLTPLLRLLRAPDAFNVYSLLSTHFSDPNFYLTSREDWLDSSSSCSLPSPSSPNKSISHSVSLADNNQLPLPTSREAQDGRRAELYSETDAAEERGKEMVFEGDRLDGPPSAWVVHWRGRGVIDLKTLYRAGLGGGDMCSGMRTDLGWDEDRFGDRARDELTRRKPSGGNDGGKAVCDRKV